MISWSRHSTEARRRMASAVDAALARKPGDPCVPIPQRPPESGPLPGNLNDLLCRAIGSGLIQSDVLVDVESIDALLSVAKDSPSPEVHLVLKPGTHGGDWLVAQLTQHVREACNGRLPTYHSDFLRR